MIVRGPEIALTLPPPPSANAMYLVRGRRRLKSPKYRAWLETVGRELLLQRQGCVGSPWECTITLPARSRADTDNFIKPVLDALVRFGVVSDDRNCKRTITEKSGAGAAVLVKLRAAS
jgi:crossover junction endodeoxyribonuclease RusA